MRALWLNSRCSIFLARVALFAATLCSLAPNADAAEYVDKILRCSGDRVFALAC